MENRAEFLNYIVNSYSFLLPRNGEFSFEFWANTVEEAYSQANMRNKVIVAFLRENNGAVIRRYGVTEAKFI